jgi:hypothetical protein
MATFSQPVIVVGPTKLMDSTSNGPGNAMPMPSMRPFGFSLISLGTIAPTISKAFSGDAFVTA